MARPAVEHACYVDPARPHYPIHAKVAFGRARRWLRISREDARALSEALRAGLPAPPVSAVPEELPPPTPEPEAPPAPRQPFQLKELLSRAEEDGGPLELIVPAPPIMPAPLQPRLALPDVERREAARALVRNAANDANRVPGEQWMDYEQALLIKNNNIEAMKSFQIAAATRKITVQQLAEQIIAEHMARGRRAGQVAALLAQAEMDIGNATGEDIDLVAEHYVRLIRNGDDHD